jgi:prepilin-type N-terminal cleavage/methylation domain-containing protein
MTRYKGFTLAELAIVLFIVGLLLAGAMIPLSTQLEVKSITETRRVMDQINEALIGYAQTNGRLPCPAVATTPAGTVVGGLSAGVESPTCTTAGTIVGVIPWSTLGVPETDAWGRRFTYRVAAVFSDSIASNTVTTSTASTLPTPPASQSPTCTVTTNLTQSSFALCSLGEIAVLNRTTDAAYSKPTPAVLGSGLAAVFVSHGKNGFGGYQINGTQVTGVTAGTDEASNASGGLSGAVTGGNPASSWNFYYRTATAYTSACSDTAAGSPFCEFDDIVYMISVPTLVSRMISAGRLP